jgi:hypothetical protein
MVWFLPLSRSAQMVYRVVPGEIVGGLLRRSWLDLNRAAPNSREGSLEREEAA